MLAWRTTRKSARAMRFVRADYSARSVLLCRRIVRLRRADGYRAYNDYGPRACLRFAQSAAPVREGGPAPRFGGFRLRRRGRVARY
jgi:hypothetical protein